MSKTMNPLKEELMYYLISMEQLPKEEIVNLMMFIETPEMMKEMIIALKEKDFRMNNREIWNAAGEIVKKHLK